MAVDAVAEAAAQSEVVSAGLGDVQVIDEGSQFDPLLGEQRTTRCGQKEK